jgi:hypothetical protein
MAKIVTTVLGDGRLFIRGLWVAVSYAFKEVRDDRRGSPALVGTITGDAQMIREAFRCTGARLLLDDGTEHSVDVVAHSEGSATAYFTSSAWQTRPGRSVMYQIRPSALD